MTWNNTLRTFVNVLRLRKNRFVPESKMTPLSPEVELYWNAVLGTPTSVPFTLMPVMLT
jgi:hypothetical protein